MINLPSKLQLWANSKGATYLLLFGFFFIVAAASHSGFIAKWALLDLQERNSVTGIMDGTAHRPFVYRQLIPTIANKVQSLENYPDSFFSLLLSNSDLDISQYYVKAKSANINGYQYGYRTILFINFLALLASLFMLRSILLKINFNQYESVLAPSAFILAFPYILSGGGYFYDSAELAFFTGAVLLSIQGKLVSLTILTLFATFNKESFLFFIPTLYPFLRENHTFKRTSLVLTIAMLIAALINLYLKNLFAGNPGSSIEFHLFNNIRAYLNFSTYFTGNVTYGLPGPSGVFVTTLIITMIIAVRGLHYVNQAWKQHMIMALFINIPLFFAFCYVGEIRNLSMLYVGLIALMAGASKSSKYNL